MIRDHKDALMTADVDLHAQIHMQVCIILLCQCQYSILVLYITDLGPISIPHVFYIFL
jgi:hypothetical protein